MYGTEDERRYPGLQAEFFQRAAAPLRRREAILGFVGIGEAANISPLVATPVHAPVWLPRDSAGLGNKLNFFVGWAAGILLWGANGSKWAALPIQNGPKKGAVVGPRGRI